MLLLLLLLFIDHVHDHDYNNTDHEHGDSWSAHRWRFLLACCLRKHACDETTTKRFIEQTKVVPHKHVGTSILHMQKSANAI